MGALCCHYCSTIFVYAILNHQNVAKTFRSLYNMDIIEGKRWAGSLKYILMHRELPVAVLSINDTSGTVYRVEDVVQPAHLPIGLFSADRREFAKNLNLWLAGRTIPASHSGFHHALEALQIQKKLQLSASTLMMKCFALSLSDQYWLNPAEQPLEWRKVNFYHNDFSEDVGNILFGQIPERDSIDLVSPCNTSDGWLKKKWKILNGQRVLVKGGSGMAQQEPFNEAAASLLCRKLGIPHVEYSLLFEGSQPYSVCTNMTTDRHDFVSGYYIFSAFPRGDDVSAYAHFLNCCEKLGIPDVTEQLQQMMILDYLICNQDRHFGNFGAIRDAVTLEWMGFAPIFDSGTSLWFDQYATKINALTDAPAKPFAATQQEQLALAKKPANAGSHGSWMDAKTMCLLFLNRPILANRTAHRFWPMLWPRAVNF